MSVPAGARYRARQETADESRKLNSSRPAPAPAPSSGGGSLKLPGAPRSKGGPGKAPEFRNYQGIILVEFVAAELLVSMTPIAVRKNQPGLSPYVPRDMMKLLAIGVLYSLLAGVAVTGRSAGRYGAWFGGFILLTVGLNEAANVAKVFDLFAGVENKLANGANAVTSKVNDVKGSLSGNPGVAGEISKGINDAFPKGK